MECLNFTHHLKHPPCRQTLASHSVDSFVFNSLGRTRGCQLGRKHWMFSPDAPNNFNSMLILRRARLGAVQVWWGCSGLTKFIMVIGLMSLCSHHKLTRTQTLFVYRPVNVDAHSLGKSSLFKMDQTTSLPLFKTSITYSTETNTLFKNTAEIA